MVPNDADKESCVCCETPKPGSTAKKAPSAFDNPSKANAAFAAAPGGGGGFNFGTAGATSPPSGGAGRRQAEAPWWAGPGVIRACPG